MPEASLTSLNEMFGCLKTQAENICAIVEKLQKLQLKNIEIPRPEGLFDIEVQSKIKPSDQSEDTNALT